MLNKLWDWLRDEHNRGALQLIGGGLAALALAGWALFVHFENKPDPSSSSVNSVHESINALRLQKPGTRLLDTILTAQADDHGFRISQYDAKALTETWTTAQSLVALLVSNLDAPNKTQRIRSAFDFMETRRIAGKNEGWGYVGSSDWSVTEIAGWVAVARALALRSGIWSSADLSKQLTLLERDLDWLTTRQHRGGGWSPIPVVEEATTRTYSTVMALWALVEANRTKVVRLHFGPKFDQSMKLGILWLLNNFKPGLGWVFNPHAKNQRDRYPGLTAQVLFALIRAEPLFGFLDGDPVFVKAKRGFINSFQTSSGMPIDWNESVPSHEQHLLTSNGKFQLEGSTFLWVPWSLVTYRHLVEDSTLTDKQRRLSIEHLNQLADRIYAFLSDHPLGSTGLYHVAEYAFGIFYTLNYTRNHAV